MTRGRSLVRRIGNPGPPSKAAGWNRFRAPSVPSLSAPRPKPTQHTLNPFANLVAPPQQQQQEQTRRRPEPQPPADVPPPPPAWPDISGFASAPADAAIQSWSQPDQASRAWLTRSLVSRRARREDSARWPELTPGGRGPELPTPSPSSSSSSQQPRPAEKPAALYLSATSTSLLPSDFYRLAPQSDHVHFWTTRNSLRAVLQARHPVTHQPLGHYTLIFDSAAAAAAYLDAARRLHLRSNEPGVLGLPTARVPRATLPFRIRKVGLAVPSWGRRPPSAPADGGSSSSDDRGPSTTPGGHAKDDFLASWPEFLGHAFDVRSFTLAPPSVPLTMRVRPLVEPGSDKGAAAAADELDLDAATLYGDDSSARASLGKNSSNTNPGPGPGPDAWTRAPGFEWGRALGGEMSRAVRNRDFEVTQVLCTFDDVGGDTSGGLTRKGVTLPSVGRLIDLDGRRRNLTWRLRPSDAVLPVRGAGAGALGAADVSIEDIEAALAAGVDLTGDLLRYSSARRPQPDGGGGGGGDDEADADANAFFGPKDEPRYKRYLLSFQDAAEAKRFAREWHKRKVLVKGEVWRVNTTALW
ncbi:hypothetical protein RB595_001642 [Gaeumannomyces hyphopodioides]